MLEPLPPIIPIKNRKVWRDLAKIISTIFNPFLTALALFVILAHIAASSTFEFWRLLFVSTFFTSLGPMLYVFWLYGSDRISDLDMSVRHERESVLGAFVVFYLLGTIALYFMHAPRILTAAMAGYTLSTIVVQYALLEDQHSRARHHRTVSGAHDSGRPPTVAVPGADPDGRLGPHLPKGAHARTGDRRSAVSGALDDRLLPSLRRTVRSALLATARDRA